MTRYFKFSFLTIFLLLSSVSLAQQYYDTHNVHNNTNDDYFIEQWRKLKNSITNYDLELANLVPMDALLKGISLIPQYEKGSDLDHSNTNQHHSSIDVWKLKAAANSEFFGLQDVLGINVEIGKEVTYIQQFEKKIKTILRLPYNPLKKIPLKSELFFKKNNDGTLVFKEGDLLIFKAPMVLGLNKGYLTQLLPYINAGPSLNYALAGVFNIQVFRMKNNFVRLTITNSLEKTLGLSYGINILGTFVPAYYILGFDAVGAVVSNNFFDPKLIQFSQDTNTLVNHTYDFIFNLNSEEARKQYDTIMGPKLNMFGSKNYEIIKRTSGIYKNKEQISKNLEMNFKDLIRISDEDLDLPVDQRRIITMAQGESEAKTETNSFQFNVLQFFKYRESYADRKALGQTFESKNHPRESYTFLSTTSNNAMDSFFKWRSRERKHTNIIFVNDEGNQPKKFKYLHQEIYEEDRTTKPEEFEQFKRLFTSDLPHYIVNSIQWPNWYNNVERRKYATLRKEVFISEKIFKSGIVITEDQARKVLAEILETRKSFQSTPMLQSSLSKTVQNNDVDLNTIKDNISMMDPLEKYRMELNQLPRLISSLFGGHDFLNSTENQYGYLAAHIKIAPLIREVGLELILKCLKEEDLKKVAYISIVLAADKVAQTQYQFPAKASSIPLNTNTTAYKDYVSYNKTLGEFNFINDRSYKLWMYFNPDASIIDLNKAVSK